MEQQDLFGTRARCRALRINYEISISTDGAVGWLHIQPQWSKRPKRSGEVHLAIDEGTQDVVPELMREAWDGFMSTDPGYYIPRWVKGHLQDYNNASNK